MGHTLKHPGNGRSVRRPVLSRIVPLTVSMVLSFAGTWSVTSLPATGQSTMLPQGAYQVEHWFLSKLGGCRPQEQERVPIGPSETSTCFSEPQDPPFDKTRPRYMLYILQNDDKNHEYQWGSFRGEFEFNNRTVRLCGGASGRVPDQVKRNSDQPPKNWLYLYESNASDAITKYEMVWHHLPRKDEPPPLGSSAPLHCKPGSAAAADIAPKAGILWQLTMVNAMGVYGGFLLGLRSRAAEPHRPR